MAQNLFFREPRMNTSELEIEKVLRAAPKPAPPAGLKEKLLAQINLGKTSGRASSNGVTNLRESWLRRWWLILTPAAVSLFCAMVLAVQHFEIRDLQETLKALLPPENTEPASQVARQATTEQPAPAASIQNEQDEITRLKSVVADLRTRVSQLERLKADNEHLRAQLAA